MMDSLSQPNSPLTSAVTVTTVEMHTGGEPVRIIESGYPVPQGKTILEKINFLKDTCDDFRKFVLWEPRGHFDMYGVILVAPDHPEADVGVIFMHNEGYSTMCGHVTISLGRYLVERGLLRRPITSPETTFNIQAPCGLLKVFVDVKDQKGVITTGRVRFESVPSFVVTTDLNVPVDGLGIVQVDIVYGGAFYAFVNASDIGVEFGRTTDSEIKRLATSIKKAAIPLVELSHPTTPCFLYGVILVDSRKTLDPVASTTLCIYAAASTDRSPCGSGTGSFATLQHHRGLLALGQTQRYKNGITGSGFIARPFRETKVGEFKAITVIVEGHGYFAGRNMMTLEEGDTLGRGFLVK